MAFHNILDVFTWNPITGHSIADTLMPKPQKPPALPQSPSLKDAENKAKARTKKLQSAISRNESIYTSPLGVGGQADINKKILLGQ